MYGQRERETGVIVVVASYNVYIRGNCPQILVRLLVTHISGAYYLLNLAGDQQFLKLCWEVMRAIWDMEVSNDQNENHRWEDRSKVLI